jgi:Ca-activated chloride channel homolog
MGAAMKSLLLFLLLFTFVASTHVYGQSGRRRPPEEKPKASPTPQAEDDNGINESKISPEGETIEGDVIRVDTSLITVPVTVRDRQGRYVPILRRQDFKLFEDGVEQKIAYFGTTDQPITVILLIDTSGSTQFRLEDIHDAAIAFTEKLKTEDSVMVISFDDSINVLTKPTTDRQQIFKAIKRARTGGGTRLYDAVESVLTKHLSTFTGRKAVVLFTDGMDTTSHRATYESTLRLAEESEAPIYTVDYDTSGGNSVMTQGLPRRPTIFGLPLPSPTSTVPYPTAEEYRRAVGYLHALCNATGGRFYSGDTLFGIGQAFTWIAEELSRQYSLGYYPRATGQTGQRRTIKVRVTEPGLVVKSRDSYIYTEKKTATQSEKTKAEKSPYITGVRKSHYTKALSP